MEELTAAYFLNVSEIVAPKEIASLAMLWEDIFFKQVRDRDPVLQADDSRQSCGRTSEGKRST